MSKLINNNGQAVSSEYVLVFFIILGMMTAMSVFFKRIIQGSIHDARNKMVEIVEKQTSDYYDGNLYYEYEPYYTYANTTVYRDVEEKTTLAGGGPAGQFRKEIDERTTVRVLSETMPPKDTD